MYSEYFLNLHAYFEMSDDGSEKIRLASLSVTSYGFIEKRSHSLLHPSFETRAFSFYLLDEIQY